MAMLDSSLFRLKNFLRKYKASFARAANESGYLPSILEQLITAVDSQGLSYLGALALSDLAKAAARVEQNNIPGINAVRLRCVKYVQNLRGLCYKTVA